MSNHRLRFVFVALVAVFAWLVYNRSGSAGALDYVASWDEARDLAAREKKPILLNFGGSW